ncbi:acetyl-CoA carboxylase biotin carboxylase subunit [Roseovarius indicus]|uniref:biotin carboxylase n=1 Tax=Roseovarius indicus TaxID=540747 RepID=A0A0T5P3R4_9RHOB|nr:acetyl-CoA carboxylase biotin carboxylase subunit [Roseovarius indicus]KRS15728.1 acetyl-CoA carboxylase [Roseovarius indicus]QEW25140.1 Biotin carboxylase [Roseovarius indicus]SFE17452.1 acetyl-CoA carboxylase, biotin carboxylase subunit [Roseovarius indicus]
MTKFKRVFIANRGEIAVRVIKACEEAGLETVVGVSEADTDSLAAKLATRAVCIGPAPSGASYLDIDTVITAALGTGCEALHPGYGFLAENADLSAACAEHRITFVGPDAETIRSLGDKVSARSLAEKAGVPVVPGRDDLSSFEDALAAAEETGFPVLLKAAKGGGGRGMQVVEEAGKLKSAYDTAKAEARAAFGDDTLYMERFVRLARHVEVQVLGDRHGNVIHLGERDCTLQRRHQKILEEGPATDVPAERIEEMRAAAVDLAKSVGYEGAGTVEFIYDRELGTFYFLEVNTRIQVEHPVTEMLTGVDLVLEQLRIAAGETLSLRQEDITLTGHVIECRINAESAAEGFRPSPGEITEWAVPEGEGIRLDTHCYKGYVVPPHYDSMLAKLIVSGADRADAIGRMREALAGFGLEGVDNTIPFLEALLERPEVQSDEISTRWVETVLEDPAFRERLEGGRR